MDTEYINIGDPVLNSPVGRGVVTGFSKEGYPKINGQSAAWCIRTDKLAYNPRGAGGVQGQLQQGPRLAAPAPLVPMHSELPEAPAPAAPAKPAASAKPAAPPPPVQQAAPAAPTGAGHESVADVLASFDKQAPARSTAVEPMTTADFNPPAVPGDTPFKFEKVEIPETDSAFLERQRVSDYYETPSPTPAPAPESSPAPEPSPSPSSSSDF